MTRLYPDLCEAEDAASKTVAMFSLGTVISANNANASLSILQ